MRPHFYVGIHHPSIAGSMERTMLSINVLENRKSDFPANKWILDSGAFTRISRGQDHMDVKEYGKQIKRWAQCGELEAAVSQDWMCEPQVLKITRLTLEEHQSMTTGRWLRLREEVPDTHLMPVITRMGTRRLPPPPPGDGKRTPRGNLGRRRLRLQETGQPLPAIGDPHRHTDGKAGPETPRLQGQDFVPEAHRHFKETLLRGLHGLVLHSQVRKPRRQQQPRLRPGLGPQGTNLRTHGLPASHAVRRRTQTAKERPINRPRPEPLGRRSLSTRAGPTKHPKRTNK